MYRNDDEIREYIKQIRELCDKVLESLGDIEAEPEPKEGTEQFDSVREIPKEDTSTLDTNKYPCLIRKKNGVKILINSKLFKIGKDSEYVDYCINDNPTISRNHAEIVKKNDGYYVVDSGSLNHTFLNGVKLEKDIPAKLENESLVQFANEVFEWHLE
jgi:hypothetical protein